MSSKVKSVVTASIEAVILTASTGKTHYVLGDRTSSSVRCLDEQSLKTLEHESKRQGLPFWDYNKAYSLVYHCPASSVLTPTGRVRKDRIVERITDIIKYN